MGLAAEPDSSGYSVYPTAALTRPPYFHAHGIVLKTMGSSVAFVVHTDKKPRFPPTSSHLIQRVVFILNNPSLTRFCHTYSKQKVPQPGILVERRNLLQVNSHLYMGLKDTNMAVSIDWGAGPFRGRPYTKNVTFWGLCYGP